VVGGDASQPKARVSKEREATVARARETWISKLIDLSKRNRLLYFREFKTGTLDLTNADSNVRVVSPFKFRRSFGRFSSDKPLAVQGIVDSCRRLRGIP
jgi:hypothetical protein